MKKIFVMIALVVPLGLAVWFYHWWTQETTTSKVSIVKQANKGVLGSDTTIQSWSTPYFTSGYPDTFRLRTNNEVPHANMFGRYMFSSVSQDKTDQIGITVGHLAESSLNELSAIQMRLQRPDTYVAATRGYAPAGSLVFSRADGTETAVFMRDGENYAAIVVSGSVTRQQILDQGLQTVVANWAWQ